MSAEGGGTEMGKAGNLRELPCVGVGKLEWRDYEEPVLGSGQVRVRSQYSAAKHGTELGAYKGYSMPRGDWDATAQMFVKARTDAYPVAVGNMVVGTVTEKHADVTGLKVGDTVLAHGGFRTTHVLAAGACRKIPEGLSWKPAVCMDPAEFALGAVRDSKMGIGDNVAVFGLGAIGLIVVQMARMAGCRRVLGIDPVPRRRALGLSLGLDSAMVPLAGDSGAEIRKLTDGRGADICIEFSGSRPGFQHALRGVAFGGTVVAGAFPRPYDAGLDLGAEAHWNRPNLVFSRACSEPNRDHPRWGVERIRDTCFGLLAAGKLT